MRRKPGDEIGGQGDEASAAGDGINETCEENERADDDERNGIHGNLV